MGLGPFVGYKLATNVGFTVEGNVGFQYMANLAPDEGDDDFDRWLLWPLFNLNVGWSF
jgi:hypothetical protein